MAKRKALSKRARFEVFKRDGFQCVYCGRTPPAVVLEPDHILAVANGGTNDMGNLVASCFDCNRGKSDVPLDAVPTPLSEQIEREREAAEQLDAYNDFLIQRRSDLDEQVSDLGTYWYDLFWPHEKGKYVFGHTRATSIRTFLKRMPAAEVYEAIDIAFSRCPPYERDEKTFRYFCAVCWNKIRDAEGE